MGEQISTIPDATDYTLVLGVVIGIVVTFIGFVLIETIKFHYFKKSVKKLVKIELEQHHDFLKKIIKRGTDNNDTIRFPLGHEIIPEIKSMMPNDSKFKPTNYPNLNPETKAKVFNEADLSNLEKTYRDTQYFFYSIANVSGQGEVLYFSKEKLVDLTKSISNSLDSL